ncbi:MAG: LysR family transcriptional regulator [Comamonas testosteroni]|uniref:LysR family transcriptional regulator n=1 Tax=Comamonas testosteroni TaxID=285 RepID=UPI003D0AFE59
MAADSSFSQIPAGAGAASPEGRLLFSRMVKQVRLRQLQLLLALQQCGSVMQAAVELNMSQSAATQALAELERVLGIKLFERHARGMRPTVAGQALIDAARSMLVGLQEVSESLASIRRGASAALRLGAIPAAALSVLSQLLPRFYEAHPQVYVDVHEDASAPLLSQLMASGLDVVFCRQPQLLPVEFSFEPLLLDAAVVIADADHPLVGRRDVPLPALRGARWVLPSFGIAVRNIVETEVLPELEDASWFPASTVSLPVLEGLLTQPGAVSLVPRSILPGLRSQGRVRALDVRIEGGLPPLGAVYRTDHAPALLQEMLRLWHRLKLPHAAAPASA